VKLHGRHDVYNRVSRIVRRVTQMDRVLANVAGHAQASTRDFAIFRYLTPCV